jgi:anti-sigma B factor antagonist
MLRHEMFGRAHMARRLPSFEMIERAPGRYSVLGEIDLATSDRLRQLEGQQGALVLDLHGVTFIDSTGVAALVRLRSQCQHDGCTFAIEAASEPVLRVLQLVNLHELLLGAVVPATDPCR